MAKPTALKTMTELMATGLVSMDVGEGQVASKIILDDKYDWFLTPEFVNLRDGKIQEVRDLCKEKYPPKKGGTPLAIGAFLYHNLINKKITIDFTPVVPLSGGEISLHKFSHLTNKPLEEWKPEDFVAIGCIYCVNNGGYKGPLPQTKNEYLTHIVLKHKGKPGYPGPADIHLYSLKFPC
jgi:hypothetical protein